MQLKLLSEVKSLPIQGTNVSIPSKLDSWIVWCYLLRNEGVALGKLDLWLNNNEIALQCPSHRVGNDGAWVPYNSTGFIEALNIVANRPVHLPCYFCQGFGSFVPIDIPTKGEIECFCSLLDWRNEWSRTIRMFESKHIEKDLYSFIQRGPRLANAVSATEKFVSNPSRWLVLSGPPGTGKSHILQYIAKVFEGLALYIAIQEFNKIFDLMDENRLGEFRAACKGAPILILDDIGSVELKSFALGILGEVINHRYSDALNFPTAMATNLGREQLLVYGSTIIGSTWLGDRLTDQSIVDIVDLSGLSSYRQGGRK